jgi:hypothetical protein
VSTSEWGALFHGWQEHACAHPHALQQHDELVVAKSGALTDELINAKRGALSTTSGRASDIARD